MCEENNNSYSTSFLRTTCKSKLAGFDYKTSSGVGLNYIPSVQIKVENTPALIPNHLKRRDLLIAEDTYKTTQAREYRWKLLEDDPNDKAYKVPVESTLYIKPFAEKMKGSPPNPPREAVSEYQDEYQRPDVFPGDTCVLDWRTQYLSKVKPNTSQNPIFTGHENEGFTRLLDPYNSTTHLDYHYKHKRDVDFYRSQPIDVTPSLPPRTKPVFDKAVFSEPCFNHLIHQPFRYIPHSGLVSETKDRFGLPLDNLTTFDKDVEYPAAPCARSKRDMLATPGMYHTEYSHISNGWPVCACVNQSDHSVQLLECQ